MKKKIHLGKLEKLVILVMVVTLAVSILPQLDIQQLFAEDPPAVTLELKEGNMTRPLSVNTTDAKAVEAVLLKDGVEAERKILNTNTPAQFDIIQNGTYVIQSIDVQGTVLEEHEQIVEGLTDLYVEPSEAGSLNLYSRIENTDHITVTFKEKKEAVKAEKQDNGLYQGSYTPKENGSYVFQSEAADGSALGAATTYEETGIAEQKEEPKKAEQPEVKEYHITNEQGLKDIAKAPDQTYILDGDITVTSNEILINREFTGILEGNGYVIKGLKQPLFSSLNKATIKSISLKSEISSNSDTAALAVSAKDTNINGVGILATIDSSGNASGMIVNSNNSIIEHSYVSGKITGEAGASGFVVSGSAAIKNSYVTGIVEGKQSAYGFGKQTDITNSYAAVYVEGKESGNFNAESKKLEGSFYDISAASIEEPRSQEYTSAQLVSGSLSITDFQQTKGSYPSLKKEITDRYSEEAKKLSALSTLAVSTNTSLMGLTKDVALPSSTGKEDVSWSAEGNVGVSGNAAIAKVTQSLEQNTEGTLIATTSSGTRVLKAASAKLLTTDEPQAGQSVAEKTTSISFNMKANHYYLITTDSDMESKLPADHKTAIASGWRRYLWDGAISWDGLDWNTTYYVYDYDLKDTKQITQKTIKTGLGKIGGSIQLSDDMAAGATLKATLKDTLTAKGTWKWEKAESPTSTTWTSLGGDNSTKDDNTESSYVLKQEDSSTYIRATFTADDKAFEGSITATSKTVVKAPLNSISIYSNTERTVKASDADMVVDKRLYAMVDPKNFDTEVDYTWHHLNKDGTVNETVQGRGTSYLLQGKDVNNKICVRATAKGNGGASGTVTSTAFTNSVAAAPTDIPTQAPVLAESADASIEDTSVTVKMPEAYTKGNGLYQFAYKVGGGDLTEFPVYARGSNPVTITGLKPRTKYFIYVKTKGENGHLDSDYSNVYLSITTENPYIAGTLEVTATGVGYRFGETLNAELTGDSPDQTGVFRWYLLNDDGSRGDPVSEPAKDGNTIALNDARYVGKRLEIVLAGTGNYSGEISAQSEIIQLAVQSAPSGILMNLNDTTDHSVKVKLPSLSTSLNGERFNIGYSKLADGVPEEYRPSGQHVQYKADQEVLIEGLDRYATYYFFIRFDADENKTHEKSDWSSTSLKIVTEKTEFDGEIHFEYGSALIAPTQGERLTARLGKKDAANTKPNTTDGTWTWYKTESGKTREAIKNYYPGEDGYSTYYEIPKDEEPGTIYSVEFVFQEEYKKTQESGAVVKSVTADSETLLKYDQEKMDKAEGTKLKEAENLATDSTITFQMDGIAGLVYGFRYSKGTDVETAEPADYDTYTGTNVTIKGLERNTAYHIWVKVKGNEAFADSDWSENYLTVQTKKTDILGYVEINGTDTAGQKLSAVYNKANYLPTGNDTDGTWQWYREKDGSFETIAGATNKEYTPTSNDIDKRLKAIYSVPAGSSFIGSKEAVTTKIKKQLAVNPIIKRFQQGTDTADSRPSLDFEWDAYEGVWYRIQKATEEAPKVPTEIAEADLKTAKWTKSTGSTLNTAKDYADAYLEANTEYTLYAVRPETGDTQVSSIITEKTMIGTITQKGTMSVKNTTDYKEAEDGGITYKEITYPVVGKTITAELKDANNVQGTWKWYKSTTDCGADGKSGAPAANSDAWEQLASGYSPTINKAYSTLTISEDLWKHYIKAEFVPNNEIGYGGDSITLVNTNYVRKIYDEQITIESSTKDGNGNDTAYSGTKITAKVENWCKDELKGRFKMYIDESIPSEQVSSFSNDTMIATQDNWSKWDGKNVYAELKVPDNIMLYVGEDMKSIETGKLYKSDRIPYKYGIPISTKTDLTAFIKHDITYNGGIYSDRSAHFTITNNINMKNAEIEYIDMYNAGNFNGELDGQFHTISYPPVAFFKETTGTEDKKVVIENLIITNSTAAYTTGNVDANYKSSSALVVYNTGYLLVSKVMLSDSTLIGSFDGGGLVGKSHRRSAQGGKLIVDQCVSSGVKIISNDETYRVLGGIVGYIYSYAEITNNFSIKSEISSPNSPDQYAWSGGITGGVGTDSSVFNRNYSSAKLANIPIAGGVNGYISDPDKYPIMYPAEISMNNSYYDKTISPGSYLFDYPNVKGSPLSTDQMIGTSSTLATVLGENEIWSYREGAYPILNWLGHHPITVMYTNTRGAFTSIDGATNYTDMFNGNISGVIKIPAELQKNVYSITSSNPDVLKVTAGGTILPVGNADQSATITITYTEPDSSIGGTASNTYDFTIKKQIKALDSVSISGTTNPGQKLTATASGASGITYQWYRRKTGTTSREAISGAASNTYTIKPSDVGYEINVDVGATNYATMSSGFTKAVTSVKPTGIEVSKKTDNSVTIKAQGVEGADYEYAYAASASGNKITAGHTTDTFTISGLSRNTSYWLFARVAGGSGYEASEWSNAVEIKTNRTDIVGPIKTNGEINMERDIRAFIGDDNLQKGTWKIERIKADDTKKDITSAANKTEQYDIYYTLTKEDVGSQLRFTYNGTGDFKDPDAAPISYTTPLILRKAQNAPSEPTGTMVDAHAVEVKHTGVETYDFGYTETAGKDIKPVDNGGSGYAGDTAVKISDLKRNTMYYLYARAHEKEEYEPSDWSAYTTVTTDKSQITGNSEITASGTEKVNETITFDVKGTIDDTKELTGIWVLERVDKENNANTVLGTVDTANANRISYQLKPEDAGYKIKATYNANGDYKGNCTKMTAEIRNAEQTLGAVTTSINDTQQYQTTLNVTKTDDTAAIYEFGYRKHSESGDITSNNVTVTWNKDVVMSGLSRNTDYDFFIRKAAKIGYNASDWSKINTAAVRTLKSPLLGNISVGDNQKPSVASTITVSYDKGVYPDDADDTTSGSWQWYLGDDPVPEADGGTATSYTIPPVDGNPNVKVKFSAKTDGDFTGSTERSFGKVFKDDHPTPKAPTVTSKGEDPTQIGSLLHLVNNEDKIDDMYYYLQSSDVDDLPALEISEDVDKKVNSKVDTTGTANTDHWIKVTDQEMDIRVEANRSYVTYVARLESKSYAASGINSTRSVKSDKEPLVRDDYDKIEEADSSVAWKTLQSKTLKYTVDGKAPTVSWKYYVAPTKDASAKWQNIDAEMKAVKDTREDGISEDGKYAISRFEVPLKYTSQYLKITMTGIDDYSGTITYITEDPLEGALITGTARIETTDTTKVLDTLGASYLGDDEKNGTFTWYRQSVDESDQLLGKAVRITDSETTGNKSTYSLTPQELDCMVYAVYTAAENTEYVGSVQTNGIIVRQKAVQNTPQAPKKVRVNGNSIQFSIPTNYKTDKTVDIPYVQIGYLRYEGDQPVNDAGNALSTQDAVEANIHWQSEAEYKAQETWFYGLKRDSDYKLFARFIPTAAYDMSAVSMASETIQTEHALFNEDALVIQDVVSLLQKDARPSNIGSQIKVSYSGEGYDEGEFLLHRSNGEAIAVDTSQVKTDSTAKTISYSYTYTKEDVGSYITAEYKAKEDAAHYQGSIKKTNSVIVTKEVNPYAPEAKYQELKRDLDTNLILTSVNDKYEYYLSKEETNVPTEGDWDTLKKKADGSHEFTNLNRTTMYYLWTRIAETDTYDPSVPVKAEGIYPAPFIEFGPLEIENSMDRVTPPYTQSDFIAFPDTLKKGTITISENKITKVLDESDPDAEGIDADIKHPVSEFMKADGSATDLVYEKGSTWGDKNFAVELVFYDDKKQELVRTDGTKGTVEVPENTALMKVFIYRVNAMSETDYIWEAMLKDDSDDHITAKLKADITMTTQISMQLPTRIQLTLDDQVMKQSTNNQQAINKSSMPMEFGIDRRVYGKKSELPELKGQMTSTTYYDQIPNGEAYLKCSNDGTNFTNITSGAWLDTGLATSEPADLMRLGADAWSGYYFSGITSSKQIWSFDENKIIDEAYKFKFIIEVSKEDAAISAKSIYEVKGKEETK